MSQAQTKHTGEMMFQKFITVFIVTAAIAGVPSVAATNPVRTPTPLQRKKAPRVSGA
jgi:hypothetical protein